MERSIGDVIKKYQDRLPEESKRVVNQAIDLAREFGHPYAHGGHLALPLLENPRIEKFLQRVGLNPLIARRNLEQGFVRGSTPIIDDVKISFSLGKALEIADENAGKSPIKPEDLFLGVLLERGLPGIGVVHERPRIGWRSLLKELSAFGSTEVEAVVVKTGRIEQIRKRQEFDLQVKYLREQQLPNHQIAEQLGVPVWKVAQSSQRLIARGETEKRHRGSKRVEHDYSQIDSVIKRLREQDVPAEEARKQLGLTIGEYRGRVTILLAAGKLQPKQGGRKRKNLQPGFEDQIKELRAQGLKNEDIREQLGLKTGQYYPRLQELLKRGEVAKYPITSKKGIRGGARFALEQLLDKHMAQHPGKPVVLVKVAREIGVSRERIRQLYPQIAESREVPPLYSKEVVGSKEEFDQQVKDLAAQGLGVAEISDELKVIKKLVLQAKSRIYRNEKTSKEERVKSLRSQGLGNKRIAEITGFTEPTVTSILQRVYKKEQSLRMRKVPRSKEEAVQFREKVAELRMDPRNLSDSQIAQLTGDSVANIRSVISKLVQDGRISVKRSGRNSIQAPRF